MEKLAKNMEDMMEKLQKLEKLDKLDSMEQKLEDIDKRYNQEMETVKAELASQKKIIEKLDSQLRKKNIIIVGMEVVNERNLENMVIKLVTSKLQIDLDESDIDECRKINKDSKGPILISLTSTKKKNEIMKAKGKLKEFKTEKIYINNDLSVEKRKLLKSKEKPSKNNKRSREENSPEANTTTKVLKQSKLVLSQSRTSSPARSSNTNGNNISNEQNQPEEVTTGNSNNEGGATAPASASKN